MVIGAHRGAHLHRLWGMGGGLIGSLIALFRTLQGDRRRYVSLRERQTALI